MANRSHLFSFNTLPDEKGWDRTKTKFIGISEWNYDVSLVQKILVSSNPRTAPSAIWDSDQPIALIGDFDPGVERLVRFLNRIEIPLVQGLREEAIEYLQDPKHRYPYLLLEPGEIFELGTEPDFAKANRDLLTEIKNIDALMEEALERLKEKGEPVRKGFFQRLFPKPSAKPNDPMEPFYGLGLGNWTEIQFYDPNKSG